MISIVCVYNNKEILNEYLLKSLDNQSIGYKLILVDNTDEKFKSAAEALNYGGNLTENKYIIFAHQDIKLSSDLWLEEIEKMLNKIDNLGIAGIAGFPKEGKMIIGNIKDGIPPKPAGIKINRPQKVQTLDECLFIIPKQIFNKFKFDENLGGWHLYAVDYCLNIKKYGLDVYVVPKSIYHRSHAFSMSKDYYKILKKLLKKYGKDHEKIYTTAGIWNTYIPLNLQRIINTVYLPLYHIFNK
jgi:GT2 family glycosyltransferase